MDEVVEKLLLLIVRGLNSETDLRRAAAQLGVKAKRAADAVTSARQKLTRAAAVSGDEELGKAIRRLEDLFGSATRAKDHRTALIAQKELHKLLGLYDLAAARKDAPADAAQSPAEAELAAIRLHLLPLGLADADYPLREHARIAADLVRRARGRQSE
ncbi:MAG: hypothetical protein HRF50_04440 [Phycisphaerae bacterium]|jgi:hypothetical protein